MVVVGGMSQRRRQITVRCRLRGDVARVRSAVTVGNIVGISGVNSSWRRRAVVAAAIAFLIAIVGAESALVGVQSAPDQHGPHALIAHGADAAMLIAVEHPHVSRGGTPPAPDAVAEAVLPRATMTVLMLALVAFLLSVPALWRHRVTATPRGPPRPRSHTLSGRDVLAQSCIARR